VLQKVIRSCTKLKKVEEGIGGVGWRKVHQDWLELVRGEWDHAQKHRHGDRKA
jgi:hypothetical protein